MEFLIQNVGHLNWWAVLLAVISTIPVGYLWYDLKVGFGKKWAKLVGLSASDMSSNVHMVKTFGMMLLASLFTAIVLGALLKATGTTGGLNGLLFGLIVGLIVRGGAHVVHNGFSKKPDELTWIDAGHDMVSIAVMGMILGLWA